MSTTIFQRVLGEHFKGDDLLEKGVMAELDGKAKPQYFHDALTRFQNSSKALRELDQQLADLIAIHKRGIGQGKTKSAPVPVFDEAVKRLLAESPITERVSMRGWRYSNAAGAKASAPEQKPPVRDLLEVMEAQRADARMLREQVDDTIKALRDAIPAAERHEFAALMLSGRAGFADKIQQSVEQLEIFARFYSRGCMATIAATMHVYPAGLGWIKDSAAKGRTDGK